MLSFPSTYWGKNYPNRQKLNLLMFEISLLRHSIFFELLFFGLLKYFTFLLIIYQKVSSFSSRYHEFQKHISLYKWNFSSPCSCKKFIAKQFRVCFPNILNSLRLGRMSAFSFLYQTLPLLQFLHFPLLTPSMLVII